MRTATKLLSGLAPCLFAITLAWSQPPTVPTTAAPPTPSASTGASGGALSDNVAPLMAGEEYVLGPGDVINVSLYGESDMTRDCSIRGDGSIFLAMLRDKIQAAGKTTEQLQQTIEEAYRSEKLLKNPLVTVSIKEFRSAAVTITGFVVRPVTIQVQGKTTLLQAITMAGGLSAIATTKVLVSHPMTKDAAGNPVPGQTTSILMRNLYDHPDDPAVNVILRGGDIVTVQRTDYVYVGGAVTKPGMLAFNEVDDWTVLKALAEKLLVASADRRGDQVALKFYEDTPLGPERLVKLIRKHRDMRLDPTGVLWLNWKWYQGGVIAAVRNVLLQLQS